MTRNRKKLKTMTNASVTAIAPSFPRSQRVFTRSPSPLDLQRFGLPPAALPRAEPPAAEAEDYGRDHSQARRLAAALVRAALRAGGDREQGLVADLLAHHPPRLGRARGLNALEPVGPPRLEERVVGQDEIWEVALRDRDHALDDLLALRDVEAPGLLLEELVVLGVGVVGVGELLVDRLGS